ncbi:MAG: hypothetical protein ISR77_24395 [Pirellulaceae bacterium]|nr:hypothetical protein [Pirellulaceae bacterium]
MAIPIRTAFGQLLMNRFYQVLLIVTSVGFSWLAMMIVHEIGHVLHALLSGGYVTRVVLSPWEFSRTDVSPNPSPLFVAWGGAAWGVLLPIAIWSFTRIVARSYSYLAAFFAGFCCVVNGAYIGAGTIVHAGDAGDMLRYGAAYWQLVLYGLVATASGFYLWNGLGSYFGLGKGNGEVDKSATIAMVIACITVLLAEVAWTLCYC